jgi:hypothetical protein
MIERYFKPPRGGVTSYRGYFSFMYEAVGDLLYINALDKDIKLYFDLVNVMGYGNQNIFDICFLNDEIDYLTNKSEYINIDDIQQKPRLIFPYNPIPSYKPNILKDTSEIIKKYFILTDEMVKIIDNKKSKFDINKTIGIHRRATDIYLHNKIVDINEYFKLIDEQEYDQIFLSSDNQEDRKLFIKRYGDKIIQTDDQTESEINKLPYFRINNTEEQMIKHIKELVSNVYILSQVKNLICTLSNVSGFSILMNPGLQYKILT